MAVSLVNKRLRKLAMPSLFQSLSCSASAVSLDRLQSVANSPYAKYIDTLYLQFCLPIGNQPIAEFAEHQDNGHAFNQKVQQARLTQTERAQAAVLWPAICSRLKSYQGCWNIEADQIDYAYTCGILRPLMSQLALLAFTATLRHLESIRAQITSVTLQFDPGNTKTIMQPIIDLFPNLNSIAVQDLRTCADEVWVLPPGISDLTIYLGQSRIENVATIQCPAATRLLQSTVNQVKHLKIRHHETAFIASNPYFLQDESTWPSLTTLEIIYDPEGAKCVPTEIWQLSLPLLIAPTMHTSQLKTFTCNYASYLPAIDASHSLEILQLKDWCELDTLSPFIQRHPLLKTLHIAFKYNGEPQHLVAVFNSLQNSIIASCTLELSHSGKWANAPVDLIYAYKENGFKPLCSTIKDLRYQISGKADILEWRFGQKWLERLFPAIESFNHSSKVSFGEDANMPTESDLRDGNKQAFKSVQFPLDDFERIWVEAKQNRINNAFPFSDISTGPGTA